MTPKKKTKRLIVEVRRESLDGKVYSQVRDRNRDPWAEPGVTWCVVIDRQRGPMMDADTVENRARSLAELTGLPFDIDLTWPCAAERGLKCRCPRCTNLPPRS